MPDTPTRLTNESGEWVAIPLTQEEIDALEAAADQQDLDFNPIRGSRNNLLQMSDWTDLPNAPLTAEKVAEWATYRQALRNYPAQSDLVSTLPDWPTPPE
jgi:hypothetical protein|tara:strand:- start:13 stop:312 length:300 start_codon:yes stop_codon:yes gene_type:complete